MFLTFGIFENLESLQQNKIEDPATYYGKMFILFPQKQLFLISLDVNFSNSQIFSASILLDWIWTVYISDGGFAIVFMARDSFGG